MTRPARSAGTCGVAVLTSARGAFGVCTASIGVPNAADTVAAVPWTGRRVLPGSGAPTVSPSLRNVEDTCATSAALGP